MYVAPVSKTITATAVLPWDDGKRGAFAVAGTFDSATVKLKYKVGSAWVDFPDSKAIFTAAGGVEFVTPAQELQVEITGGLGSESLDIRLAPTRERE